MIVIQPIYKKAFEFLKAKVPRYWFQKKKTLPKAD